ncbi:hypothetical protein [Agromyces sp. NPDC055661]
MCRLPIAYGIPGALGDGFELDHFYSVPSHPHLVDDWSNFRPSHSRCNRARGDGAPRAGRCRLSRKWF